MADEFDTEEEFELTDESGEDYALNFGEPDEVPSAQFGGEQVVISGTIRGAQWGAIGGEFSASDGVLTIPAPPLADSIGGAGLLAKAEYKTLQGKSPTIVQGTLNLPLAQAGLNLSMTTEDTPGGIKGIGYGTGECFGIVDGVIFIPQPPTIPAGINSFPVGVYNAVALKKMTWAEMGTGVVPMTNPSDPKEGDLRIAAFLLGGGYLSLMLQKYIEGGWS